MKMPVRFTSSQSGMCQGPRKFLHINLLCLQENLWHHYASNTIDSCSKNLCCAGLAFCEPDAPVTLDAPSATPNDALYPRQTNLEAIQVPAAWKTGQFGSRQVLSSGRNQSASVAQLVLGHISLLLTIHSSLSHHIRRVDLL